MSKLVGYWVGVHAGHHGVRTIDNTLEALQKTVGGYIESTTVAQLRDHGIVIICNEEGVLQGLDYNINMYPFFFVGDLFLVSTGEEDFESLSAEQIEFIERWIDSLEKE